MAEAPQNTWNNSWGNIYNVNSNPPAGWTWNQGMVGGQTGEGAIGASGHGTWTYTGITPQENTTIYQTSSIDCDPEVDINTGGEDPVIVTPTVSRPPVPSTPPAPPVSTPQGPVPMYGQIYNVCFDDGLLNQK